MKLISCFFIVVGLSSALASNSAESEESVEDIWGDKLLQEGETLTATVNDYADQLMKNMDKLVLKAGMDPMVVPDMEVKISRRVLLIKYWGKLKLSKIKVNDFSTIHRYDDAVITYNKKSKKMRIDIPLELKDIKFSCKYSATLMGLGPWGGLDGKMKSVRMMTSMEIDYSTFQASVVEYKITHTDHITVKFHEFILVDWLINILANTVTTIFKGLIVDTIDKVVEGTLQASVNMINTIFTDIEQLLESEESTQLAKSPTWENLEVVLREIKYNVS